MAEGVFAMEECKKEKVANFPPLVFFMWHILLAPFDGFEVWFAYSNCHVQQLLSAFPDAATSKRRDYGATILYVKKTDYGETIL